MSRRDRRAYSGSRDGYKDDSDDTLVDREVPPHSYSRARDGNIRSEDVRGDHRPRSAPLDGSEQYRNRQTFNHDQQTDRNAKYRNIGKAAVAVGALICIWNARKAAKREEEERNERRRQFERRKHERRRNEELLERQREQDRDWRMEEREGREWAPAIEYEPMWDENEEARERIGEGRLIEDGSPY